MMKRSSVWSVGLAWLSLSIFGCGPDLTASERLAKDYANAYCGWALSCCHDYELLAELGIAPNNDGIALLIDIRDDPSKCEELILAAQASKWSRVAAAERDGRVSIPAEASNACLDYYRTPSGTCDGQDRTVLGTEDDPCSEERITEGLVEAAGGCSEDWECSGDQICRGVGTFGICAPPQAEGEACDDGSTPCADGLYCSGLSVQFCTDPNEISDRYCDRMLGDDNDCSADRFCSAVTGKCELKHAPGESCETNDGCLSGLCDSLTKVCATPVAVGDPCYADLQCGQGNFCNGDLANASRCVPTFTAQLGDRCDPAQVRCGVGLACENGICVVGSGAGGWCDYLGARHEYCPETQFCASDNVCTPRVATGGECNSTRECVETAWCNGGVCEARVSSGTCFSSGQCVATQYCSGGTCVARPGLNGDCSTAPCSEDLYCSQTDGLCATGLSLDSTCYRNEMCATGGYCTFDPNAGNTCLASRTVALGDQCYGNDENASVSCGAGAYCDTAAFIETCQPLRANGSPCGTPGHTSCSSGYCNAGTCEAKAALDGLCSSLYPAEACVAGTYCDWVTLDAGVTYDYRCTARGDVSAACTGTGLEPECLETLHCSGGLCTARGTAGASCDPFYGDEQCVDSAWCNTSTYLCESRIVEGGTCPSLLLDQACVPGTHCTLPEICQPTQPAGALCDNPSQCDYGLACVVDGVCRPQLAAGAACDPSETGQCIEFHRCDNDAATCMPLEYGLPNGAACRDGTQCESGACDAGLCVAYCVGIP